MEKKSPIKRWLLSDFLIGMLCLLIALLLVHFQFLNNKWEDLLVSLRFFGKGIAHYQEPAIIQIDDESIQRLGPWPWPHNRYVEALQILSSENASVVGLDLLFQSLDPDNDLSFAQFLEETSLAVVLGKELKLGSVKSFWSQNWLNQGEEPALFPRSTKGYLNLLQDRDGLFRQWPLPSNLAEPAFVEQIYHLATKEKAKKIEKGVISFVGGLDAFPSVSFYQFLAGDYPPNFFSGKIVLIGVTRKNIDRHAIALPALGSIPGVYLHAYLLRNLLEESWFKHVTNWISYLLLVGIAFCWAWFSKKCKDIWLLGASLLAIGGILLVGLISGFLGYIFPIPAIIAMLILQPLLLLIQAYRLEILERQKIKGLFSKYVSPEILAEILEHKHDINFNGERRFVAIFFADVRGFTKFTEEQPPEVVVSETNQVMAKMAEIVRAHRGLVNKFLGDGIMAVFGIPQWEEHMMERVFAACLEIVGIQGAFLNNKLQIGIGLAWGIAVAGSVGSQNRMEYTVMGSPVNLASRLEKLAGPGEIVFSCDAKCKDETWLPFHSIERVEVKGINDLVMIGRIKSQ